MSRPTNNVVVECLVDNVSINNDTRRHLREGEWGVTDRDTAEFLKKRKQVKIVREHPIDAPHPVKPAEEVPDEEA